MTIYDAAMALVVVAGMVRGAWRGFTWQAASIASLVLGYTSARSLSGRLAASFPGEPEVQRALAMAVVYLVVSGGVFGVAWMVRGTLRKLKFDAYDRHLGTLLGGLEGLGVGLLLTLFVVSLAPTTRRPIFTSPSGRLAGAVMNGLGPVLPGEVRSVLAPLWDGDATDADAVAAGAADSRRAEAAPAQPAAATPAPAPAPAAALPAIEEAASEAGTGAATAGPADLPPLEGPSPAPASGGVARASAPTPPAGTAAPASPDGGTLDALVEKTRREVEQAVAGTLDTSDGEKAKNLRQLADKERQRLQGAVGKALGKTGQDLGKTGQNLGSRVRSRVSQGQQRLERAIAEGQNKVDRAISQTVDQQLQGLGGLEPAPQKGPQ